MQVYVYKNSMSQQKLSLRGHSPACKLSGWMGPIVSLSFELGTMGALLRVSWSNLTSCAISPGKQLEVAARGPPCVWPLCCNLEGGDCKLLFTLQFLEKHKISYKEKSKFLSWVFTSLCMLKYIDFPICMYVSFSLGSGYFVAFHVFLSILLLCTLYKLKTFLKLHIYCKLN